MIQVTTKAIMESLENHEENEICYVHKENKYYKYINGAWEEMEKPKGNLNMNLYEMNKTIVTQLPKISKKELAAGRSKIRELSAEGSYFMLLCNDLKYYTIFHKVSDNTELIEDLVIECITDCNLDIKSINYPDEENKNAIEIWTQYEEDVYVMYFFNYDGGIVECAQ